MLRNLFVLILLLNSANTFAHQDSWYIRDFGNVQVKTMTGYDYEEIDNTFLIGKLVEKLCSEMSYSKPIRLNFLHSYSSWGYQEPSAYGASLLKSNLGNTDTIQIFQYCTHFTAQTTIKLVEYSLLNLKQIPTAKSNISISFFDSSLTKQILEKPNSEIVKKTLAQKVEKLDEDFKYGTSYYLQNNRYTLFTRAYGSAEKQQIVLDHIFQFKEIDNFDVLIFDTDSSFYYINNQYYINGKYQQRISKKHIVRNKDENYYAPHKVVYLGGNKISIHLNNPLRHINEKERTLLYLSDEDELIQDLDKLIESGK